MCSCLFFINCAHPFNNNTTKTTFFFPLFLSACLLFSFCSKQDFGNVPPDTDDVMTRGDESPVTKAVSLDFQVHLDDAMYFAELSEPEKQVVEVSPIIQNQDTLMYVIQYDKGWKLLSGDRRIQPVLINEPEANRTPDEFAEGELYTYQEYTHLLRWMKTYPSVEGDEQYLDFWQKLDRRKGVEVIKTKASWDPSMFDEPYLFHKVVTGQSIQSEYLEQIGNLTYTSWKQTYPYNTKIPQIEVEGQNYQPRIGCVSLAIGQLLYYLHFEKNLSLGLYEDVSMSGTTSCDSLGYYLNYSLSKSQFVLNSTHWNMALYSSAETQQTINVQDFLLVIGEGVNMRYEPFGSRSDSTLASIYLNSINIQHEMTSYSSASVASEIRNGYPLIIFAQLSSSNIGHCWLIDGYGCKRNTTYENFYWEVVYPSDPSFYPIYGDEYLRQSDLQAYGQPVYGGMEESIPIGVQISEYIMMNWGAGGQGLGSEYYDVSTNAYWPYIDETPSFGRAKRMIHNYSYPTQ